MTDHDDLQPLPDLDERARAAARGLQAHVALQVDAELSLSSIDGTPRSAATSRVMAVAAVVALLVGSVALLGQRGGGDGRSEVDLDEMVPEPQPGQLRPLGPRDGRNTVQLPTIVEPSTGLRQGDIVSVTTTGFLPGEQVGIVQCAREAGGDSPETRGGVDGCDLSDVTYADANADGVATSTYEVRRVVTTPLTGTVDCAAEAERCLIGVGALSDYDRSGGQALTFVAGGEPIDIPTATVSHTEGLVDGQVVHVSGTGFQPGTSVMVTVCSTDPASCWETGDADLGRPGEGMQTDDDGAIEADVPVWRFLPGIEAGTYVDCLVSRCSLRISGETAPPTIPLAFRDDGATPSPPALAAEPTRGLAPGDEIAVRGTGFEPDATFYVSVCASPPGAPEERFTCASSDGDEHRVDEDGTFLLTMEVPDLGSIDTSETTISCEAGPGCGPPMHQGPVRCDGVTTECAVVVDVFQVGTSFGPPVWSPEPVRLTYR